MHLNSPSIPPPQNLRQDLTVIGLVGLAHATSHFFHLMLVPLFPIFMTELNLSFSQVGLLTSVFFIISGTGQAMAGFLVDRVGARWVLCGALGLFVLAALTASMSHSYAGLMSAAALAGLGNASFHPVDFTILNQRVSLHRLGHAFSVHGIAGTLGWAAAPVFFVGIALHSNWRNAYLAAAVLALAVLGVMLLARERLQTQVHLHPVTTSLPHRWQADFAFLKLPVIWGCFGFFVLTTMTLAVVQIYSVPILQALQGVSLQAATTTLTAYMLCSAGGMVCGGFLTRQMQSDKAVVASLLCAALLLAWCASGYLGAAETMTVLAAVGFAVGLSGPSRDMLIKKAAPKGATGRVYGAVYSGLDVGFALAPLGFGLLMDRHAYAATWLVAAGVLLLAVWVALEVGRRIRLEEFWSAFA